MSQPTTEYLLRYMGHYAVRILSRGYEVVADAEATRFPKPDDAHQAARVFNLRGYTVEPAPEFQTHKN